MIKKLFFTFFGLMLGLGLFAIGLFAVAVLITYPTLPSLHAVQNYQPKMPLMIYSADGKLIGSFGEERRTFTKIEHFPKVLKDAVLAAEDKRFYEHWGMDLTGVARAMIGNIMAGSLQSGASTITQQVAKNFYLSSEKTFTRKFNEALLAYKIEQSLSKDQILELYFNQIYLGQRAYGFTAAAKAYFNKDVADLTLAEASMLAGLPKAPSTFNPIVNPERARLRQEYILNNMVEIGSITPAQRKEALAEPLNYQRHHLEIDQNSLYVAEMVRQELYDKYGEDAYTKGFTVYTTVHSEHQRVATKALRRTLSNFGSGSYRGAESYLDLSQANDTQNNRDEQDEIISQYLSSVYNVDNMQAAVVIRASKSDGITAQLADGKQFKLSPSQMGSAKNALLNDKFGDAQIRKGAVIRVIKLKKGWRITQEPPLQGAIVSLDAHTGAIRALVGGYNFHSKSFNRATQAQRQPGSAFKPFIYAAALSKGMTASTLVNDAPITIAGAGDKGRDWTPKNSDGRYAGLISLRQALTASKNMVSIRILQAIGVPYTQEYIQRFGFKASEHPSNLSMALGAGSTTPLQMAEAYAVFANGGYRVSPYLIDKIYDSQNRLYAQMQPLVAGQNAKQVIDPRHAFVMYKIMQDVVRYGTARAALSLGRSDIAGKTGTTNDNKDAWFVGFNPSTVTAVYIGFDKPRSMGRSAFGGTIALPVWVEYMRFALNGTAHQDMNVPAGMVMSNGEYFLKEQQSTNPNLPLDNSSSENVETTPLESEFGETEDTGADGSPSPNPDVAPSPAGSSNKNSLDQLF